MITRIPENALILPAVECLYDAPDGELSTADLIRRLEDLFEPEGEDAEILEGRQDSKFSQKVRNLKSHKTLEKLEFADATEGGFRITDRGKSIVDTLRS